jgi:diadenosine tetraphosphate (Ap4A) HIT family hydrolase
MLTDEQVESIKAQLIQQIESSFPDEKKEFAISQIETMDAEQLEEFLIKNNLLGKEGAVQSPAQQCVFCSIVFGDISSYKIAENSKAIAILEINPLSRGHILIIPKEHITTQKSLPKETFNLSKKISSLIKKRLKPKEVKISSANILGHEIFNIIPIYEGKENPTEKKPANTEELVELQRILTKKASPKRAHEKKSEIKEIIKKFEENIWLPKRIP